MIRIAPAPARRRQAIQVLAALTVACSSWPLATADRPTSTVPQQGIRNRAPNLVALTNARLVTGPGKLIANGVVVIRDGLIAAVGERPTIPPDAHVLDMQGKTIYPALIDAYSEIRPEHPPSPTAHWNPHIHPEFNVSAKLAGLAESNKQRREAGFALRLVAPSRGVVKGKSVITTTAPTQDGASVVANEVAQHVRLTRPPNASRTQYPNSPMGAVALARQTFYDADWYARAWRTHTLNRHVPRPETNDALDALSADLRHDALFVFDAPDEQYALRANRFAIEFGLTRVAIRGSGREYQRLETITSQMRPLILPLDFPKPPNVATAEAARDASLTELMHWHLAPENPARLHRAGAVFAFTTHGLSDPKSFHKKVRQAVQRGLDKDEALAACTVRPAELFGIEDRVGTIESGKSAHLMVTNGDWLQEDTRIVETWVDGQRFQHRRQTHEGLVGTWQLTLRTDDSRRSTLFLKFEEENATLQGVVSTQLPHKKTKEAEKEGTQKKEEDTKEAPQGDQPQSVKLEKLVASLGRLTAHFSADLWSAEGTLRLTGTVVSTQGDAAASLIGEVIDPTGRRIPFRGTPTAAASSEAAKAEAAKPAPSVSEETETPSTAEPIPQIAVNFPLGAYGVTETHREQESVLLENATIWTCGPQGTLENASILLREGRIAAVGQDIPVASNTKRIDVGGKHITPGIIDCHSHMATDGGVNESTQAITAEVRIGDFIDATDISIYRQLAGGVTTSNILHGSANPIGGQNQVIKLRWGMLPEQMKFAAAPAGIKFALGENVKQSNWGDDFQTRYPQSRLGVEQIMRDALLAAQQYEAEWEAWKTHGTGIPPRKDLELDALLEILKGQRWIHCHSYRQDEILALIRTLDDFGIRIGTFQHILEGYKVAKEMAEHGAMGSAFSDWWAYKFEVYDAIPYNGALMHQAGIVVSFNSDDAELARHLNHEAAKAMKYGGVPAIEALKFVTLNPARQLRIDKLVGSLEVGKHADLVVWSGDPLQITSRCEQTWIEGIRFFDITEERKTRNRDFKLRQQLVQRILDSEEPMRKPGDHELLLRDLFPRYDEYCGHGHDH